MIRLTHIIAGLEVGGVQNTLCKLVAGMNRDAVEHRVISLTGDGPAGAKIRTLGVPVETLGMRPGVPNPLGPVRLARTLRRHPPDIIQTWMYHADLIGSLAALGAHRPKVIWGVRYGNLDWRDNRFHTLATAWACARLSGCLPERIVCCSDASRRWHEQFGYSARKLHVIPNGFDTNLFRPDQEARHSVRRELDLPNETELIGFVARFDPQKDHRNFIAAAAEVAGAHPSARFVLCGGGVDWGNRKLSGWIEESGARGRFHLLGHRDDIPRLAAALDIAAISSSGEGFPNFVGEAMSCGVPCVVTDVGAAAELVGGTGKVVPPRSSPALAAALREMLAAGPAERSRLGELARRRVAESYSLATAIRRYEDLYREVAESSTSPAPAAARQR